MSAHEPDEPDEVGDAVCITVRFGRLSAETGWEFAPNAGERTNAIILSSQVVEREEDNGFSIVAESLARIWVSR